MMCKRAFGVSFSTSPFTVSAFATFLAARIICAPLLANTRVVSNPFPDVGPVYKLMLDQGWNHAFDQIYVSKLSIPPNLAHDHQNMNKLVTFLQLFEDVLEL